MPVKFCFTVTDIHQRSQNMRHLDPGMGAQIRGLRVFSVIEIIAVCMCCGLSLKTDTRKTDEDHDCICFALSLWCVVGKNPKTPKLSPVADYMYAITRGDIGGLESLVYMYICVFTYTIKIHEDIPLIANDL